MQDKRSNIKAKKHLGQHFLHDKNIAQKIAKQLQLPYPTESILEIGPGTGMLTQFLLNQYEPNFFALDVDQESIAYLKETYPENSEQFMLADFLHIDIDPYAKKNSLALIGNLPYNVSSPIFFKILDNRIIVSEAVFMIQLEVAQRISAKHGSKTYGILSVLLQSYYTVELLFKVGPKVFVPPPKVDSAVVRLTQKKEAPSVDFTILKTLVKTAFNNRRKTLRNALKPLNLPADLVEDRLFDLRAEALSVEDFQTLASTIQQQ